MKHNNENYIYSIILENQKLKNDIIYNKEKIKILNLKLKKVEDENKELNLDLNNIIKKYIDIMDELFEATDYISNLNSNKNINHLK